MAAAPQPGSSRFLGRTSVLLSRKLLSRRGFRKADPDRVPCASRGRPPSLLLALLLSLWLGRSSLGTQEPPDAPTSPAAPGLNLKFDPRTMRLSWDCQENITRTRCFLVHQEKGTSEVRPRTPPCECAFRPLSLHLGVTLRVSVTVGQRTLQEELLYSNPGAAGTAAQNFSCVIYRATFMNCTWTRGPAAPSDVQYFLYLGDVGRANEKECPHYLQDSGTHRGCHVQDLSALPFNSFFLVNGTSRRAEIQFYDSILSTKEIERISAPDNVSVLCNSSHCCIRWTQPRTKALLSDVDFQYQLGIRRQDTEALSDESVIEVAGDELNQYLLLSPEPRARHTLRIRAADSRGGQWGDWSQPVDFGSQGQETSLLHVYLLVIAGTLVCALVCGFLLHRLRRLFPPIPQVKDKVNQSDQVDHQMNWEDLAPGAGKEGHEDVLIVEEVS